MGSFKWIAGLIGWASGGPIGALVGFLFGSLVDSGIEPFYRLGVTIENFVVDGFPRENTMPPKDFAKWGRICEHIIRH